MVVVYSDHKFLISMYVVKLNKNNLSLFEAKIHKVLYKSHEVMQFPENLSMFINNT